MFGNSVLLCCLNLVRVLHNFYLCVLVCEEEDMRWRERGEHWWIILLIYDPPCEWHVYKYLLVFSYDTQLLKRDIFFSYPLLFFSFRVQCDIWWFNESEKYSLAGSNAWRFWWILGGTRYFNGNYHICIKFKCFFIWVVVIWDLSYSLEWYIRYMSLKYGGKQCFEVDLFFLAFEIIRCCGTW